MDKNCSTCIYGNGELRTFCKKCLKDCIKTGEFRYWIEEQQQPQEEEINHPSRYNNGKYECIDVMQDVFGKEAVKHFCLLNAFKYIWRQEHKGGTEDVKKAVWYLNKCIELEESEVKDETQIQ